MGSEGLAEHSHQAAEVLLLVAAAVVAAAGLVALSSFASSPPTPSESCKSSQQACGSIAISNLPSHTYLLPPSWHMQQDWPSACPTWPTGLAKGI